MNVKTTTAAIISSDSNRMLQGMVEVLASRSPAGI